MTSTAASTASLLAEVIGRIDAHVQADRADAVRELAQAYVRRISPEGLQTLLPEQVYGRVVGLFELADGRGTDPFVVRVCNPALESDGYTTLGTVIETNCEDSPFLVDSVSEELTARELEIRVVNHPVIGVERDEDGRIRRVVHAREAAVRESLMHFELQRRLDAAELGELAERVRRILRDVQAAVRDFGAMTERVRAMIETARAATARYERDEIEETELFLRWLLDGNFVFLGSREYAIADGLLSVVMGAGLGILRDDTGSRFRTPVRLESIEAGLRDRLLGGGLLVVSKTNRFSTVHRHAKMDDLTVKRVAADGSATGALRIVGLFTRKAYMAPASRTPILSRKLRQIADAEDYLEGSHDHKAAVELFESFPKDELFAASVEELRSTLVRLLDLQERRHVQLFVRRDLEEGRVSVLVALPHGRFNAELRRRLQKLFVRRYGGSSSDYHLSLGDEDQARLHFTVHVDGPIPDVSFADLEQEVVALARTWDDRLREQLVALHGPERGERLADRYGLRFPDYYKSATDVSLAALDVEQFERLDGGEPFVVALQNERGRDQNLTRVGLYKTGGKVVLSDFVPLLEDLGLTVVEEVPTRLVGGDGETFLHDFGVLGADGRPLELPGSADRIADCISAVWRGDAESDSLNRLVVGAGLTWRQVVVLRAYRTYRLRVGAAFGVEYKNTAYARNPGIAAKLVRLFELRFDPAATPDAAAEEALHDELLADLDRVRSLDEDRILRAQLGLVDATVRTNAFRQGRRSLSFKFASARVPDMPKPCPLYEIFVYSPEMEGIHLRGGRIARGGIRWSDRLEDYRTETLGLMKAQMVKNAVIVPVGSKGGFVLKQAPGGRAEVKAAVLDRYATLIRGLLDLTDNLVDGRCIHPPDVRVLDEDDPYLVVAADKGTATFSDAANEIASEYGFWLGDAFASGGSTGYDHKALGITARGAWKSVERHFRELGRDIATQPFTAVGIGDMSGDVFGNGMLRSRRLRLVAAFDHRHLFIDPGPDPATSFEERKRLYELPGSSWDDYDRARISPGGGVWPRSAKRVELSAPARAALGVEVASATPNDVVAAILRAPVDLFWNGGIGTFVKASYEENVDVGDRTNDAIRVDGRDLRVKVVAEGGNLGFTQKGRIEYALAGGRINTDAVDNSAGVDASDHEVNLKILLGIAVASGDLTREERNELLRDVEQDVASHVLYDNYLQVQVLSQEVAVAPASAQAYEELMEYLEAGGLLDREVESLPSTEQMTERRRAGQSLTRPELCLLLAYAKRSLEEAIGRSSLPDDPYLDEDLRAYFPTPIVERFGGLIDQHPLRRDLAATILANAVVNDQGITFVSRLGAETGAEPSEVVRAFRIAREVTDADRRWADVEALDGKIDPVLQNRLMVGIDTLVDDISRWYLLHDPAAPLGATIAEMRPLVAELAAVIDRAGSDSWRSAREEIAATVAGEGVGEALARRHAFEPELAHAPDIIAVSKSTGCSLEDVAHVFFLAGERLRLDWLERRLVRATDASSWDRWAVHAMGDDLMALRRDVAQRALSAADSRPVGAALDAYLDARGEAFGRLVRLIDTLDKEGETGLAALTVALRQVRSVVG